VVYSGMVLNKQLIKLLHSGKYFLVHFHAIFSLDLDWWVLRCPLVMLFNFGTHGKGYLVRIRSTTHSPVTGFSLSFTSLYFRVSCINSRVCVKWLRCLDFKRVVGSSTSRCHLSFFLTFVVCQSFVPFLCSHYFHSFPSHFWCVVLVIILFVFRYSLFCV
jgi:hypothetical protein